MIGELIGLRILERHEGDCSACFLFIFRMNGLGKLKGKERLTKISKIIEMYRRQCIIFLMVLIYLIEVLSYTSRSKV